MTDLSILLPGIAVVSAFLGVLSLSWWLWVRLTRGSHQVLWAVYGLRLILLATLVLLLIDPACTRVVPDPSAYEIAFVVDASGSMETRDAGRDTRFARAVASVWDEERGLLGALHPDTARDVFVFSEEVHPAASAPAGVLAGGTDLGGALRTIADRDRDRDLGAVVLVSDGHATRGVSAVSVAKDYARRGVPITCLGVGGRGELGDVAVRIDRAPQDVVRGDPVVVEATVTNSFSEARTTTVQLLEGDRVLQEKAVDLGANTGAAVSFAHTPDLGGFRMYAVRLLSQGSGGDETDVRADTDIDFAGVEVRDPAVFRVLFLAGRLGWEFPFLRSLIGSTDQLELAAVIRTGPATHFSVGLEESLEPSSFLTDLKALDDFDVLVLDAGLAAEAAEREDAVLDAYVADRGGGLLVVASEPGEDGTAAMLPALLPATVAEPRTARVRTPLEIKPRLMFAHDPAGQLSTRPGPFLAGDEQWLALKDLKRAAATLLTTTVGESCAMAAHTYGRGRSVVLGTDGTWRWRLASTSGSGLHESFWRATLVWLGSTGKPRLTATLDGKRVPVHDELELSLRVLGPDYRPADTARVTCSLTGPEGERRDLVLEPDARTSGLFTAFITPGVRGQYQARFEAHLEGETLEATAHFVAAPGGEESADTRFREDILRDLARITGGLYVDLGETSLDLERLPVSQRVNRRVEAVRWVRFWWVLLICGAVGISEWWLRRRVGFR